MFSAQCPDHPRPMLVSYDDVTSLRRDRSGYTLTFRCSCGRLVRHHVRSHAGRPER
jgi:hypothetical protein